MEKGTGNYRMNLRLRRRVRKIFTDPLPLRRRVTNQRLFVNLAFATMFPGL